jgi:hypothetical protein
MELPSDPTTKAPSPDPVASPSQVGNAAAARGSFEGVIARFIREIESLATTFPLAMRSIVAAHQKSRKEYRDFVTTHGEPNPDGKSFNIDAANIHEMIRLRRDVERASAASSLVPRSFLVALVSQYDSFLGLLIETLFLSKPEILNQSDKIISFSELVGFGSVEAARDHVIEKEIESVLRKSHAEQFDWLESSFKIKLRKGLTVWPEFIEITERRNLFVHTGGQVSAQYLKICRLHDATVGADIRGKQLSVTPGYFDRAYEVVFEVGVKLAHVFWRKLKPQDRKGADRDLVTTGYNLLVEEKYSLAKTVLDFGTDLKTHSSEELRLRLVVNRAQAYKWAGQPDRAVQILEAEDFSALKEEFRLAEAVLRDDFHSALALVRVVGSSGGIKLGDYRDWPLFKEFRKIAELEAVILEVFNEPLNRVDLSAGNPNIAKDLLPALPVLGGSDAKAATEMAGDKPGDGT